MAYGDFAGDRDLMRAWEHFCDRLKASGKRVFKDQNPAIAAQRVDGFRYLAQNLGQAYDLALETRNTKYPVIHPFCGPFRKLGGDNADCIYLQAWIDGQSQYKISGNRGQARFFNIAVQGPRGLAAYGGHAKTVLHEPFGDVPEANIFGHRLKTDWDGSFELYIGGEKRGPNWLPSTKGTRKLFFRQYFDNFEEEAAQLRIERVGMDGPRPIPSPQEMIEAMNWAADFVYNVVDYWPDWTWANSDAIDENAVNQFKGELIPAGGGVASNLAESDRKRGRVAIAMHWQLLDDEALVLEFENYQAFWMITCEGMFGNSMDFLYRPVSYTPSRSHVDADGRVRFVMCGNDPGVHNWIDTQGYRSGQVAFRSVQSEHLPDFRTQVVKAADVSRFLPADTRRVTAEERSALMLERFHAIQRRYRI